MTLRCSVLPSILLSLLLLCACQDSTPRVIVVIPQSTASATAASTDTVAPTDTLTWVSAATEEPTLAVSPEATVAPSTVESATAPAPTDLPPTAPPPPTPSATVAGPPSPNPAPANANDRRAWMPSPGDIPPEMVLKEILALNNREMANRLPDSDQVFADYEAVGRDRNINFVYVNKDGCAATGFRKISPEAIIFRTVQGAGQYYSSLYNAAQSDPGTQGLTAVRLGQRGFYYFFNQTSDCGDSLRVIRLYWLRSNVIGVVDVEAAAGAKADAELYSQAMRLGQTMDARMATVLQAGPIAAPTGMPIPSAVPIPSGPPGIYVTELAVNPPNPKRGQPVSFTATFVNTADSTQTISWLVLVYEPDKKNSLGETAVTTVSLPPGMTRMESANNWAVTGKGGCITLYARAYRRFDDGSRQPLLDVMGNHVAEGFAVCP